MAADANAKTTATLQILLTPADIFCLLLGCVGNAAPVMNQDRDFG
jgi:hypothetical protein